MKHKKPMQVKTASPRTNMIQYVYHKGVAGTTSPRSFGGRKQLQKRRGGGSGGKKNNSQITTASKTTVLSGLTLCVLFGKEEETIPPLTMCVPKRPTTSSGIEKSSRGYSSNWVKMTQRGGGHGSSRFRQHAGEDKHMIERGIDRLTSVVVKQSSVVKGNGKKHHGGGGGLNTTRW